MRLELLCEMNLVYDLKDGRPDVVFVRPYGTEEGSAFGSGTGMVIGETLSGSVRWFNHPHRRSDKTMLPNVHGMITTQDNASVLFTMEGRTTFQTPVGNQLLTITFEAEAERYRWLSNAFCVLEGLIDMSTGKYSVRIYHCINELAEEGAST